MLRASMRAALLTASRRGSVRRLVERAPVSRNVVSRFVAGVDVDAAVRVTGALAGDGLSVSLDHLGEDTTEVGHAEATTRAYLDLLRRLSDAGFAAVAEVSVKLSAVGQALDHRLAVDNARTICAAARAAGTTVTIDMEDHATTDATLDVVRELRADFPTVGAVLQAYLRRTESDCRDFAYAGSRVRLCKGAYYEPDSVAFGRRRDVQASYLRCLRQLVDGGGYPMVATHDPTLVTAAETLLRGAGRTPDSYEFQLLYGVRLAEQRRLVRDGHRVRVYVPYGEEWYGYLMRRLAERPANVGFFLRALSSRH